MCVFISTIAGPQSTATQSPPCGASPAKGTGSRQSDLWKGPKGLDMPATAALVTGGWTQRRRGAFQKWAPPSPWGCPPAKGRAHPEERRPSGTALPGPGHTPSSVQGGEGPRERLVSVLLSLLWAEARHFRQTDPLLPDGSKHVNNRGRARPDFREGRARGLPVPPGEGISRLMSGSEGGARLGRRPCARCGQQCVPDTVPSREQERVTLGGMGVRPWSAGGP